MKKLIPALLASLCFQQAAWAMPDCGTVLDQCVLGRRCRASLLRRCVKEGQLVCALPTTTSTTVVSTTSTSVASTSTSTTTSTTSTSLVTPWCLGSDLETPCGTLTFCDQPGENPPPCNSSVVALLACRWAQLACQADVDRIALSLSSLPPPDLFRASGDCSGTQQFSLDGSSVLNLTCPRCCPSGMEITLPARRPGSITDQR